jgi:hypothetical protein
MDQWQTVYASCNDRGENSQTKMAMSAHDFPGKSVSVFKQLGKQTVKPA